jgi:hypothetical protein
MAYPLLKGRVLAVSLHCNELYPIGGHFENLVNLQIMSFLNKLMCYIKSATIKGGKQVHYHHSSISSEALIHTEDRILANLVIQRRML